MFLGGTRQKSCGVGYIPHKWRYGGRGEQLKSPRGIEVQRDKAKPTVPEVPKFEWSQGGSEESYIE